MSMIYPTREEEHHVTGRPALQSWDHASGAWVDLPEDMPEWERSHERLYSLHERIYRRWLLRLAEHAAEPNEHKRRDLHKRIGRLGGLWWDAWRASFDREVLGL